MFPYLSVADHAWHQSHDDPSHKQTDGKRVGDVPEVLEVNLELLGEFLGLRDHDLWGVDRAG